MLDNIEANLNDANDYLEKAEKHLANAKKWHEKTRTVSPDIANCCCVENVLYNDMPASCLMHINIRSI